MRLRRNNPREQLVLPLGRGLAVIGALVLAVMMGAAHAQDFNTDIHTAPNPQNAVRTEANAALDARDYAKAERLLKSLLAGSPADAVLLYDLGSAEDAQDEAAAAEHDYRSAIAADGKALPPRVALGLLLARAGKLAEAREQFAAAVLLPGDAASANDDALKARAYRSLARLDQTARPADARDELLAALKLSSETPQDTLLAAELAQNATGGQPAAEATYRRLLTERPDDAEAAGALAHLLIADKRAAEAEPLLEHALTAHPGDPALTVELALAYGKDGKAVQAVPLLEALHRQHAEDSRLARLLGEMYFEVKNYAAAEPLLAAAVRATPHNGLLLDDYAETLLHVKKPADAEQLLASATQHADWFPDPAALGDAAGHLAFAASQNDDPAGSLRALDLRATVLPPTPVTLFLAAIAHDKLHQVKAAQLGYKQFLAASNGANPDEEFEAKGRLIALEHSK